ncbi:MAG: DUF503 domain-containing protein [Planctomycetes bacterium]|nr:DUF503 domain-containing protein [Planctomycetota bacterium]
MATALGVLHLDVVVSDAMSLKDKRRIVKSFLDRTRARHNVSVALVEGADSLRRATLAVAMIGSDLRYVQGGLQKIANAAEEHRGMVVVSSDIEML